MSERVCRDCSQPFQCEDSFFLERGLSLPARCPWCRRARRQERITRVIDFVSPRGFGFIAGDDGTRYYITREDFGSDPAAPFNIDVGRRVAFMPAPGQRGPRARRVEILEDTAS